MKHASFDRPVPPGGYAWWYVDAMSDDGRHGLTVIAFVGSVFSPYYARARRRGSADPLDHCAVNVALYGGPGRWTMTERGRFALSRSRAALSIGPSTLRWDGDVLVIEVREIALPFPHPVRGTVRLHPLSVVQRSFALDRDGRHRWQPVAPSARVEVTFSEPDVHWKGHGYHDTNWGMEPLEDAFAAWTWSRASTAQGNATMLYDVTARNGTSMSLGVRCTRAGEILELDAPNAVSLGQTRWRVPRATRTDRGGHASVVETFEDTPFYARSLVATHVNGQPALAMHESLSLERFRRRWVQALLPFRMPRRSAWRAN